MLQDSAFVTVGEPARKVLESQEKVSPTGEFEILSRYHFSRVVTMVEGRSNPSSFLSGIQFALHAYRETRDCRNIYLGEEYPGIQYLIWQALLRGDKRIVMLVHNIASKKRQLALSTLGLARHADHLLCLSPYSKQILVERYGVPDSRITVVYSRVDTDYFFPDPEAEVRRQICSAGAVNRDYATLIDAARGLNVDVKIAADTAWRYSARSIGQLADLPHNVEMHSWETYLKLRKLYAESQFVVVPLLPRHCISGITVALEAMAMGKAVILSRNPYVEGFIEDGNTGFYVEPGNPQELRARIEHLLAHPEVAQEVGMRARSATIARFSLDRYVERIMSVWQELR